MFAKSLLLALFATVLPPTQPPAWKVLPQWVKAHEDFLASDMLRGRGSATRDEGIAATYVGAQFEAFGLQPAPGMNGFVQAIDLAKTKAHGGTTYNAIGFLPGTGDTSGTLLITSHLDHLGIGNPVNGDNIYNGADDDASGTTAVLELAHALASGPPTRRSLLFICFGSEERGGFGADYIRQHPPVPLANIVANVEFEMIGTQDPKMPKNTMLFTGWERSNLGPALKLHGAKLGPDPYPSQELFRRSDNYALALQGVVAHTAAGFPSPAYYHRPDDDLQHLDFTFLTTAIQSMVEPLRWLANSSFKPQWNANGRPH